MSLGYVHMKKAHKPNLAYLNQYIIFDTVLNSPRVMERTILHFYSD